MLFRSHCVIIGLTAREDESKEKQLYIYENVKADPVETRCGSISAYLFPAEKLPNRYMVISETTAQLNGAPRLKTGVQMIDDGIYTFEEDEYLEFISKEPNSIALFKKSVGGDEYINGHYRYILYLANTEPQILKSLPLVTERIQRVRDYRSKSSRSSTVAMSNYPTQLGVDERLSSSYLVIPNTSSERREYIPIGWLEPDIIANQKLRILANPDLYDFALLTSRMHMAWMRTITGRMKSDYMYSVGVVYNNFPWPDIDDAAKDKIRPLEIGRAHV